MVQTLKLFLAIVLVSAGQNAQAEITRIWLTHKSRDPGRIVVNWETEQPGNSVVRYAAGEDPPKVVAVEENVTLHHVEIPLSAKNVVYRYRVASGDQSSAEATFKGYPTDVLRVAVAADWQGRPNLDALLRDDPHLLLTAGDNIDCLHRLCGAGVKDCTRPYAELIDAYPALFRSTPFMPVLGNHDREIRPRGPKPPAEAVYDVDATAFRTFFELPGDEWKWHFEVPEFGVRFIALDFNHISDMGTTWQTCHPLDSDSEQFRWYERLTGAPQPPWTVTLYNEKHSSIRGQAQGAWQRMIGRGSIAVTGFGYFAERAETDGFPWYNTSLSGRGAKYPDPHSRFFASVDSYLLLTFTAEPMKMTAELKSLDGQVLDRQEMREKARAE